jgi:HlyD family secretion protein
MKRAIYRVVWLSALAAAGWYGYRYYKLMPEKQTGIPVTRVQRGDVLIRAFARGELRAVRSVTLYAPNLNGTVQVTSLAPQGALAKEKDLVIEYDDSERQAALEEARLSLESVDEQIKMAKANMSVQQSEDAVTLLKTRYDVRRAELDVQRNPILDVIDAKKNILTLEESKRALKQLEADIAMRQAQADSQIAVLNEQRNRVLIDVAREEDRIAQTKSLAPITGLVSIKQNRAGFFNFGQQLPDIREGDTLQPGMPVADILDLSELEVWTKIGEIDRANLREGEDAILQLDAIPDKRFHGRIKMMSGTATADVFSGDPSKKFDVIFSIDMQQLLASAGMKPAEIARIMATAAANARKAPVDPMAPIANPLAMANPLQVLQPSATSPFSEEDRKKARLPLPPDEDSEVQALLRPGLLADVEIVVEKIPDALHVPAQAVFHENGKYLVYVQGSDGRYLPREVELRKQSESTMVLAGGVKPGETIALSNPTAQKSDQKDEQKSGAMSGLPGAAK